MTFNTRALLTALTLVLILAGLLGYATIVKQQVTRFAERSHAQQQTASALNAALYQLSASLGYGGFINNFGHYVVRRKPRFLEAAKLQLQAAEQALAEYTQLAANADEHNALYTIRQTLELHRDMLGQVETAEARALPAEQLGQMVQVDERLAHLAMNKLAELTRQRISQDEEQLAREQRQVYQLFGWGLLGLPALAFIGGLALGVCKRPRC